MNTIHLKSNLSTASTHWMNLKVVIHHLSALNNFFNSNKTKEIFRHVQWWWLGVPPSFVCQYVGPGCWLVIEIIWRGLSATKVPTYWSWIWNKINHNYYKYVPRFEMDIQTILCFRLWIHECGHCGWQMWPLSCDVRLFKTIIMVPFNKQTNRQTLNIHDTLGLTPNSLSICVTFWATIHFRNATLRTLRISSVALALRKCFTVKPCLCAQLPNRSKSFYSS